MELNRLRQLLEYNSENGFFFWKEPRKGMMKHQIAGTLSDIGYVSVGIDGKYFKAHRLAWFYVYGEWPKGQIDHINGDRADNRLCNLRVVTHLQNTWNRKKNASTMSGYKGVSWRKASKKWKARIRINGHLRELGCYDTPEEAHQAYVVAAEEHFGIYARMS